MHDVRHVWCLRVPDKPPEVTVTFMFTLAMDCSTGAALATEEWMFFDVGGPVAGAESVILVLDESPDEGL